MKFGHHPDPANDFCIEVEELQAIAADKAFGISNPDADGLESRVVRALQFNVGGDEIAVNAKHELRLVAETLS